MIGVPPSREAAYVTIASPSAVSRSPQLAEVEELAAEQPAARIPIVAVARVRTGQRGPEGQTSPTAPRWGRSQSR